MRKMVFDFMQSVYKSYVENWCISRGYNIEDWNEDNGFYGESFVSFYEFCDNKFKDEELLFIRKNVKKVGNLGISRVVGKEEKEIVIFNEL